MCYFPIRIWQDDLKNIYICIFGMWLAVSLLKYSCMEQRRQQLWGELHTGDEANGIAQLPVNLETTKILLMDLR